MGLVQKTWAFVAVLLAVLAGCNAEKDAASGGYDAGVAVHVSTAMGEMEWTVYPAKAPISASNFLAYVDAGHFDGATFYRVVRPQTEVRPEGERIEVVQGGLFGAEYVAGTDQEVERDSAPLPDIAHETTDQTGMSNSYGTISWARGEPGTASSEFFINLADNQILDTGSSVRNPDAQGYATFGRVTAGMDVLEAIQDLPTGPEAAAQSDIAIQILQNQVVIFRIERKTP